MSCLDGRKWTERRLAGWSLFLSIVSFVISVGAGIYFSYKTNQISLKTFCIDKASTRLDELNTQLYEIPKYVSGCAVAPKEYCNDARSKVAKVRNVSFQMGGLLSETSPNLKLIDELTTLLNETEETLKVTDGSNSSHLVQKAHQISLKRRGIAQINAKDLLCIDLFQ